MKNDKIINALYEITGFLFFLIFISIIVNIWYSPFPLMKTILSLCILMLFFILSAYLIKKTD